MKMLIKSVLPLHKVLICTMPESADPKLEYLVICYLISGFDRYAEGMLIEVQPSSTPCINAGDLKICLNSDM